MFLSLLSLSVAIQAVPEAAKSPVTKVRKICVSPEAALGSRIPPKPVCRTKDEWAAIESSKAGPSSPVVDQLEQADEIRRNFEVQSRDEPRP